MDIESLKYPVGKFRMPQEFTEQMLTEYISVIADFPKQLKEVLQSTDMQSLNFRYRPDGWTAIQVVNHCADSHMNAFIRFKLTLTETNPTIKPYLEPLWAAMPDGINEDIEPSVEILTGLHARWKFLLINIQPLDWERSYVHPESKREFSLRQALALYAWHCQHHLAHIESAIKNKFE